MKLTLIGHDDRYAVEQLQMALFPEGTERMANRAAVCMYWIPVRCIHFPWLPYSGSKIF